MKNNNLKKLCLCLSHQIQKDLSLSFDALKRIKKTSKVFKEIKANFFVTTGWQYDKHLNEPMCKIMSKYASNILNVDEKNKILIDLLHEMMRENSDYIAPAVHCFSASRHLERIADLAVNISEEVIYLVQGDIVRHQHGEVRPNLSK